MRSTRPLTLPLPTRGKTQIEAPEKDAAAVRELTAHAECWTAALYRLLLRPGFTLEEEGSFKYLRRLDSISRAVAVSSRQSTDELLQALLARGSHPALALAFLSVRNQEQLPEARMRSSSLIVYAGSLAIPVERSGENEYAERRFKQ